MIETSELRESALKDLMAVLQREGKTAELYEVLLQFKQYLPDATGGGNDTLYLGFLTGKSSPEGMAQARAFVETHPNVLAYRMTLVLGLLQEGRSAEALELLAGLSVNWFEVRDRWKLLAALTLYREGHRADAETLVAQTDPDSLLPEEQRLLEEMIP